MKSTHTRSNQRTCDEYVNEGLRTRVVLATKHDFATGLQKVGVLVKYIQNILNIQFSGISILYSSNNSTHFFFGGLPTLVLNASINTQRIIVTNIHLSLNA